MTRANLHQPAIIQTDNGTGRPEAAAQRRNGRKRDGICGTGEKKGRIWRGTVAFADRHHYNQRKNDRPARLRAAGQEDRRHGPEKRHRDRPGGEASPNHRHCGGVRCGRGISGAVRQIQGEDRQPISEGDRPAGRQTGAGDRHHPDTCRRGQDHHHRGPGGRSAEDRKERCGGTAGAVSGAGVRHQGRRRRRRLRPGDPHGGHQPPRSPGGGAWI